PVADQGLHPIPLRQGLVLPLFAEERVPRAGAEARVASSGNGDLSTGGAMSDTKQRLSVIGLGKLGSPMAACFAAKGFEVVGVDVSQDVVDAINDGRAPVFEPQLQEMIDAGRDHLRATTDTRAAVAETDVTFMIVPTPSGADGTF